MITTLPDDPARAVVVSGRRASRVALAWTALGMGTLLILTGPTITPYYAATYAASLGWPVGPGLAMTAAGAVLAWSLWRRCWRVQTVALYFLGGLFLLTAVGFAIQAWELTREGLPPGFVYPVAPYSGLAALSAIEASMTWRTHRLRGGTDGR